MPIISANIGESVVVPIEPAIKIKLILVMEMKAKPLP